MSGRMPVRTMAHSDVTLRRTTWNLRTSHKVKDACQTVQLAWRSVIGSEGLRCQLNFRSSIDYKRAAFSFSFLLPYKFFLTETTGACDRSLLLHGNHTNIQQKHHSGIVAQLRRYYHGRNKGDERHGCQPDW